MSKNISELYELVSDLMTREEFDKEIRERHETFGGLLNDEAIAHLIIDERNRSQVESDIIADMESGASVSLVVAVEKVAKPRKFTRKNGTIGQVVNLTVSDKSESCRLTLWDDDVEEVKSGRIREGSEIKIVNGYVKITEYGKEINIGKYGLFFVD